MESLEPRLVLPTLPRPLDGWHDGHRVSQSRNGRKEQFSICGRVAGSKGDMTECP